MQRAPKEKANGREAHHRFRRGRHPFALKIPLRFLRAHRRHGDQPDVGKLGCETFEVRVVRAVNRPRHVRLTGANPHLAHEHIREHQLVAARDGQRLPLGIRLERLQLHAPDAIFTGGGGMFLAGERNGYLFARGRPAPNRIDLLPLQHHAAAEDRGHGDLGLNREYRENYQCRHAAQGPKHSGS